MKKFLARFLLVLIGVCIFLIADVTLASGPGHDPKKYSECNRDKIDSGLWTILGRPNSFGTAFGGQRDSGASLGNKPFVGFYIRFDNAVFGHCNSIPDNTERWLCKRDAIIKDQEEVRAYLDSLGIVYRTSSSSNVLILYFDEGDRSLVCNLSNYDEVVDITPVYRLENSDHSLIYDIDTTTREILIRVDLCIDTFLIWHSVADNVKINIPTKPGISEFDYLDIGNYIYYVMNDDFEFTRIIVLQNLPDGNH
jgi:hypothetical protein